MELDWYSFFGLFAIYFSISYFFLKNPQLIHKKKFWKPKVINDALEKKGVLHISHRGGSMEQLENTMLAFRHAINVGTNYLEMDIHLTKDGEVIVAHDKTLDRVCGVKATIRETNFKDLPPFLPHVTTHFAIGAAYDATKVDAKDKYFPKLEEVFEAFPNTIINLDLKFPTDELIIKTNDLIKKYDREQYTVWGAPAKKHSDRLYENNPNIARFFSLRRFLLTYLYFCIGLLPFVSIDEQAVQIPSVTKEIEIIAKRSGFGVKLTFFFTRLFFATAKPLFEHLNKRGILCIYWVLNNEEDFDKALEKNPNGIMTDYPTMLTKYLKEKNLYLN